MTSEIRIYVEGGGEGSNTKATFRQAFKAFLKEVDDKARANRISLKVIACGSRDSTLDDFKTAVRTHPDAFNVMLVDSEGPVNASPLLHLQQRDNWDTRGITDEQCHLMVQLMEAWFIADVEALQHYYGQNFNPSSIPRNPNVEQIAKDTVFSSLEAATRQTQKGRYHKTRHGSDLLSRISASKVRGASTHCDRLFITLSARIESD